MKYFHISNFPNKKNFEKKIFEEILIPKILLGFNLTDSTIFQTNAKRVSFERYNLTKETLRKEKKV